MNRLNFNRISSDLPVCVGSACLDSPAVSGLVNNVEVPFTVAGWYLARENDVKLILVYKNGDEFTIPSAIVRKDVLIKIAGLINPTDEESKVGFAIGIPNVIGFKLYFEHNDHRYPWIEIDEVGVWVEQFQQIWSLYHSCGEVRLPENSKEIFQKGKEALLSTVNICRYEDIKKTNLLNENQKNSLLNTLARVESGEFLLELASSASLGIIHSPISHSNANIRYSFLTNGVNHLCIEDGGEYYYILQYLDSFEAFYIPKINLFLTSVSMSDKDHKYLIEGILLKILQYNSSRNSQANFVGYHVGYFRPYHFLYDMMPAFNICYELGLIPLNTKTFAQSDNCFIDVGDFYGLNSKTEICPWRDININLNLTNGYLLKLSYKFNEGTKKPFLIGNVKLFDNRLLNHSINKFKINLLPNWGKLADSDFLLWIGVTGQKRRWIEQVSGYAEIINALFRKNPKLGLVFDGWTNCILENGSDPKECDADNIVVKEILSKINPNIPFVSLIGQDLITKVGAGSQVDFFIANGLTGAMNVARVCQKFGIGHMSSVTYPAADFQHIHYNIFRVDMALVEDVKGNVDRIDFVSYSIDVELMKNLVLSKIDEFQSGSLHNSSNLRYLFLSSAMQST